MDKNLIEYCEIEGIEYNNLDSRQIKIIKKSFSYTGYELNKCLNELLDVTIKPIIDRLVKLIERK